jgi:hypothetical protein
MKTYEEFIQEAYKKSYGDIEEGLGAAARWAGRGLRGVPGLQTALGLGVAGYRLSKGDKTGAALAAGSAIPGPVGWGFLGADIAREVGNYQKSQKPTPSKPKPPTPSATTLSKPKPSTPSVTTPKPLKPVLSKLGGVEGTGVGKSFVPTKGGWKSSEKERYEKYKTKV